MPVYVQLFNGEVLQFPDDTPREVVDRVAQQEVERLRPPEPAVQEAVPQPVAPRTERTWGEAFKDVGAGVVGGVGNVLAFPGQVAQLIPGLREAGQALSAPGEAVSRYAEDLKSEGLKVREALRSQAISDAEKDGMLSAFATAITSTLKDPALISTFLSEQVPLLLPPLAAARITQMAGRSSITAATRGLSGDAARVAAEEAAQQVNRRAYAAAVGTGAAMQGADISSGAYQRAYQAAIQQGMTPEEAADAATSAARIAGAGAFGTSLVTQRLPGARAIEERFARLPGTSGRIRSGVGEATSEGLEEAGGALFQNLGVRQVDPTVSLTEGVGAAAGLGVLGGGFFGTLLGKRGKESLAPGQREGESLEQTINRLSAERAQLMPQELEQQFPNAQQLIEMVNKNPEQGYSTIVKYIEQLKTQPDSPEKEQALQTAEEIRKRLSVENIERQVPSQKNVIPDKDLRNLGFSRQDPMYQELVGKDLANPADAKAVVDYLKAELQKENLPERRQTVVSDMLTTVDQYLSTMPGSGFYVGEIDTARVGAGAGVVQQPGRQPATAVGATERDGVAPAGEPVPKPVARTERQQPALVFETSKGSIYAVDADGKTSRTKRSPGRGQNETYPPHEAFYVSTSDADRLLDAMRTPEGRSIRLGYRDGNMFRSIQNRSEIPAGAQPFIAVLRKDTNQLVDFVSAELTPRLGLAPVEKLYTPDGVSSTHIGHPIVKIGKGRQAQVQNPVTEETLAQYGIKPASAVAKRILGKSQDDLKVQEELAKLKPQKPAEKPSEKPAGTTEEVDESLKLDGEAIFGTHKVAGLPIQYMLVKALKLSKDVPQFKSDADENGIVQKLSGKFDWRDLGPLQVWQRTNGDFEIISGRHRFDLAKSNNIQYLPVQIHKEADGFDVIQAKTLDAELNIRDGYGKVKDYVNYFQGTQLTREEAKSRGLLDRDPGKRGFDIANSGSPEIIAAHRANRITDQDAALVANAAPNNARLQAVGLKVLEIDKRNGQAAVNTIKGVKAIVREQGGNEDLFGWDDSAIQEATKLEKIATRKQDEISRRISVLSGVTKNPKIAAQEGIDVKDPDAVKKRIADLRKQRSEWDRWETNPELIAEIRQELGEPVEARTPASEVRTPASFAQEIAEGSQKLDADEDVQYYQNNVDAIEAELKKLQNAAAAEAQDQMFSLRPEEMEARYRELEARAKREEPAQPATVTTPPDERALAIQRRVAAIDAQLKDLMGRVLSKYGLQNVGIELVKDMQANGEYANQLIWLADNHPNPLLHLRHESVHALKELGFFTPQQWATLEQRAKDEWIETYLKNVPHKDNKSRYDAYTDLFKEQGKSPAEAEQAMIEEAIADAFSYFQKAKPPAGFLASINNRIKNFFKAIKEFLSIGNLTAEDIFGKIEAGQLRPLNDNNPAPAAEPPKLSLRNVPQIDRERSLNNKRISPRFPTAVKATEETLGPVRLQPDLDTFKRDPVAFKYNVGLMSGYPNFTDIKGTADQRAEQMINRMRDNLLWLYKHWNQDLSNRSKLWYVGGNRIAHRWAEKYGIPPETAAAIIAALSPQKDWFQNVSLAERTLDALIFNADTRWDASMDRVFKERAWTKKFPVRQYRGKTLKEIYVPGDPKSLAKMAVWIRAWDEGHNPQTARVITPEGTFTNEIASGKTGKPVAMRAQSFAAMVKTLQILQDSDLRNFSELIGKNHKVRSFYNNIIAPFAGEDVTIDTHAVAAALMRPLGSSDLEVYHNFGSAKPAKKDKAGNILVPASKGTKNSAVTGLYGTYAMYAEAYRRAAADAGILPREMQSITWEAIRGLFRPEQKQAKLKTQVNALWNNVAKGKLSGQEAREQISKLVSGIEDPAWVKSPAGSNDSRTDSSYATELFGAGVSGREPGPVPSRAGERAAGAVPKLSIRAQTQTPEFKEWFGDSKIVDADGNPKVMYHGTARDITVFLPKQANAIFVTEDPKFAESFSDLSQEYMRRELFNNLDNEEKIKLISESADEAYQNNEIDEQTRDEIKREYAESPSNYGLIYGSIEQYAHQKINDMLPSMANILPVFVKSENPFDFENSDHIEKLRPAVKNGLISNTRLQAIRYGYWEDIESGSVQKAIRQAGFDGFYVQEGMQKNLAVYSPTQIKSAIGNVGTFSLTDPDIRKSLRAKTSTPTGIPNNIWMQHIKTKNIESASYGTMTPQQKSAATKSWKTLNKLVTDFTGSQQAALDLMARMNAILAIRDAIEDEDTSALEIYKVMSPEEYAQEVGAINDPDIRKSLRSPQQSLRNTLPANVWDRVDDTIGVRDQKSWPQRIMDAISPSNWSTFRENALNRYNELAVYDREYIRRNGGARLMADESAEAAALMSDLGAGLTAAAFGVNDRIGGVPVYRNGLVRIENMNGTVKGPLAIFAPLAQYKNPEVYRLYQFWATAQRGQRLNAEGKLTPFTPADMQAVRAIEAQYPEFRSIHNEWIKYNDGLVDFMKQAGVITPEMADAFRMHGDYFPMYKYMEDDVVTGPKTFTSIANVPIPKKFKGDDVNPMGDFFENVVRNTQAAIQAGIKNIAAQKATKVAMAIGQVRPLGYDRPGPNGTTVFVPAKPAKMLSTYYRVLENGEERYYAAADMKFINAIKALNIPDLPFIGFLAGPANVLRNLVTKTPDFMMANMLRDSLSAWATSGTNILPIVSTIRNFGKAIANKSPELDMLVRTGAVGGYDYSQGVEMSAKIFAQDLRKIAGARTTMENIARPATSVWEALEKGSAASDAATRMEVYKKVLDETGNEAEAVFRALEVMNFNRKGRSAIVRILTAAVPFLNARMQGLDVLYRAGIRPIFAKDATPYEQQIAKSFWVRGMTIMALSAMYWAMTHDDDEYKKQEQETRDNYWLIPSMGIKIPIPFEVGVMFKVIPERVLELSFGSDTGKDFVNSMARQLTSTFAFNPIPQTFLPIVEAATNYSFFTQRPIIGQGLENIAAPYQAAPTTSRTATGLADAYNAIIDGLPANVKAKIAASPMIVDQLIQGYTGSMGMYAVMAIDGVISANSDIPNATKRFEQMPVIRRFAIDPQARGTVTSFYDLKNSIDQVVRTANLLERTGKYDEYVKYVQENAGALSMRGYVNSLEKTMKEMREMKTRIRSSTIDADTKRDQLTAVQELENSLTSNIQTVKKTL